MDALLRQALNDGTVLRISIRQVTVLALVLVMIQPILAVWILAVVFSAVLAKRTARLQSSTPSGTSIFVSFPLNPA